MKVGRGRSVNLLNGFKNSCHHQRPAGGVKAVQCDMANLQPEAARGPAL